MSTFMKVLLGIGAAAVAYKFAKPMLTSAREYHLWYAGRPGDTTSMTVQPGREQFDIPAGAVNEPWGGYSGPRENL